MLFFYDPTDVGNLISDYSTFSKSSLNIWKFLVHVLLKPCLENLSISLLAREMSTIVRLFEHSLALPFYGNGMKTEKDWKTQQWPTGLEKISFHPNPEKGNDKKFTQRLSVNRLTLARLRCINRSSTSTPCFCMILNVQLSVTMI